MRKRGYLGIYGYGLRVPLQMDEQKYMYTWTPFFTL